MCKYGQFVQRNYPGQPRRTQRTHPGIQGHTPRALVQLYLLYFGEIYNITNSTSNGTKM